LSKNELETNSKISDSVPNSYPFTSFTEVTFLEDVAMAWYKVRISHIHIILLMYRRKKVDDTRVVAVL